MTRCELQSPGVACAAVLHIRLGVHTGAAAHSIGTRDALVTRFLGWGLAGEVASAVAACGSMRAGWQWAPAEHASTMV